MGTESLVQCSDRIRSLSKRMDAVQMMLQRHNEAGLHNSRNFIQTVSKLVQTQKQLFLDSRVKLQMVSTAI